MDFEMSNLFSINLVYEKLFSFTTHKHV